MKTEKQQEDENLRAFLAMALLVARHVNKPAGPSAEQLVEEAVRAADLMMSKLAAK